MKNIFPARKRELAFGHVPLAMVLISCSVLLLSCASNPEKKIAEQLQVKEHAVAMREQIVQQLAQFDTIQDKEVAEKLTAYGKIVTTNYDPAIFEREIRRALQEKMPQDSLEALAERLQDPKFIAINARLLKGIKNNNLQTRNAYFQDDRVPLYPKYKKAIAFGELTKYMQPELAFASAITTRLSKMQPAKTIPIAKKQKKTLATKAQAAEAAHAAREKMISYELRFLTESDLDWLTDHASQPLWQQYYTAYELGVNRALQQIEEKIVADGSSVLAEPIVKTQLKKKLD